jgi:excisionase family DNA binding protein
MIGIAIETNDRLAYSVDECAALTSISKAMLRKEIKAGRLKVKRAGRRVLILKDDFMNYLNEGENENEK